MSQQSVSFVNPIYAGFLIAAIVVTGVEIFHARRRSGIHGLAWWVLGGLAVLNFLGLLYFWLDHINLHFTPTANELIALQQLQHAIHGEALYPIQNGEQNFSQPPFFHLLSIPFALLLGTNLATLRLVAIVGTAASAMAVFRIITEKTASNWWGLIGVGLFANAVSMTSEFSGTASPLPWLLCCALLGTYLIDSNRSERATLLGVLVLCNSLWFHQAGLFFVLGGLIHLTWVRGATAALRYWLLAAFTTVIIGAIVGPILLGSDFLNLTILKPLSELAFSPAGFSIYAVFVSGTFPVLAFASAALVLTALFGERNQSDIWHIQLISAIVLGFMTTIFVPSATNLLVLSSVWFIIVGLLALYRWTTQINYVQKLQLHVAALFASFVVAIRN